MAWSFSIVLLPHCIHVTLLCVVFPFVDMEVMKARIVAVSAGEVNQANGRGR